MDLPSTAGYVADDHLRLTCPLPRITQNRPSVAVCELYSAIAGVPGAATCLFRVGADSMSVVDSTGQRRDAASVAQWTREKRWSADACGRMSRTHVLLEAGGVRICIALASVCKRSGTT